MWYAKNFKNIFFEEQSVQCVLPYEKFLYDWEILDRPNIKLSEFLNYIIFKVFFFIKCCKSIMGIGSKS